jgi:hypothetical protein
MKVYFSCTIKNLLENSDQINVIRDSILNQGCELARDWIPHVESLKEAYSEPRSDLYTEIMSAISSSDVCIFDISAQGLSIGFQGAQAVCKAKPTLLLNREGASQTPMDLHLIARIMFMYFDMHQ